MDERRGDGCCPRLHDQFVTAWPYKASFRKSLVLRMGAMHDMGEVVFALHCIAGLLLLLLLVAVLWRWVGGGVPRHLLPRKPRDT